MSAVASTPGASWPAAARAGGWSLIAAAILFMAAFTWLAVNFDYPDVLDRPAAEVLPRLHALGDTGRSVWALYALIPLLLVPAGVGVEIAFARVSRGAAKLAHAFALLSAVAMLFGLARWSTSHWALAAAWPTFGPGERVGAAALFAGLNAYLGTFLGEFVGELGLNLFFVFTAFAMQRTPGLPRWSGPAGMVAGGLGLVAMLRNITPAVGLIAEANNLVLPLWLVVLGLLLVRGEREWRPA